MGRTHSGKLLLRTCYWRCPELEVQEWTVSRLGWCKRCGSLVYETPSSVSWFRILLPSAYPGEEIRASIFISGRFFNASKVSHVFYRTNNAKLFVF